MNSYDNFLQQIISKMALQCPLAPTSTAQQKCESFSSLDSTINELSVEQSKFYLVFIENWDLFLANVTSFEIVEPLNILGAKYIVYKITVVTDHLSYVVEKRYRDFLELYHQMQRFFNPKTVFPRKTHFRSKICPLLTEFRKGIFDQFMSQLISMRTSNKSVVAQFLKFLNLRDQYQMKEMNQSIFFAEKIPDNIKKNAMLFGELLRHELLKISILPNQSLKSLLRIEKILSHINKGSVKMQDLRCFLIGSNKSPGLIETGLANDNQIVGLAFMKLFHKILKFEFCPYAEAFKKILQNCSPGILLLQHEQLLSNVEYKNSYFQLVDFYIQIRNQGEQQISLQKGINCTMKSHIIKLYMQWKNSKKQMQNRMRRKTQMELNFNSINFSEPKAQIKQDQVLHEEYFQEKVKLLQKGQLNNKTQILKQVDNKDNSSYRVSQDKKLFYFSLISQKGFEEVSQIIQQWSHNQLVVSYYMPQELTKICKVFIKLENKPEKLFQFFETVIENTQPESQKCLRIKLTPHESLKQSPSFYFYCKAREMQKSVCQIQILYYFHSSKIQKLFEKQMDKVWERAYSKLVEEQSEQQTVTSTVSSPIFRSYSSLV